MRWPDTVPFDASKGAVSPALEALLDGAGSTNQLMLLVAGPAAQAEGWAARAAGAIADALAARGKRVILADLSLNRPELHELLGVSNEQGLTDIFLFGASLEHTTLSVPGKSFRFLAASPYTPDPAAILLNARWRRLFDELARNRCKLVVYLPLTVEGAAAFAERAGNTVVLAAHAELDHVRALLSDDVDVIGVVTPGQSAPESHAGRAEMVTSYTPGEKLQDEDFEKIRIPKDGARDALIADLRKRQRAAMLSPPPSMEPLSAEESVGSTAAGAGVAATEMGAKSPPPMFSVHRPRPTPKRSRGVLLWLLVLLLIAAVVAGTWYVWRTQLGGTRRAEPATEPAAAAAAAPQPAPTPPPTASGSTAALPFSVAIASYHDLEVALGRLDQLVEMAPQLPFYIGPIDVQGRIFFRIMAGPLPDSTSAALMRDTLIAKRIKTISSGWDVVNAPLAFVLGQHEHREDAEAQQDAAVSKGIPSYIVANTGADGSTRYIVYAGAFSGTGDAEFMRAVLKSAGLADNLVEITGNTGS